MVTTRDLIGNASVSKNDVGFEAVRSFQVSGLAGNRAARMFAAILAPGVPRRGTPHPVVPGIRADVVEATAQDQGNALVIVRYRKLDSDEEEEDQASAPKITISAALTTERTQFDSEGQQILLTYIFNAFTPESRDSEPQPGFVEILVPTVSVQFSRREGESPGSKALDFVGKLNSRLFFSFPEKHWLCTRIDGNSQDGGATYNVLYEFQLNRKTWDATVAYFDKERNEHPPDLNLQRDRAIKTVQVYETADFDNLNLGVT